MTTPDNEKGAIGLVVIILGVAVIVLAIDWKIKQDILSAASKVRFDVERFERSYYAGKTGLAEDSSSSWDNVPPVRDTVVDGNAGMEAPVSLEAYPHGVGKKGTTPRNSDRVDSGAGSGSVEIPEDAR